MNYDMRTDIWLGSYRRIIKQEVEAIHNFLHGLMKQAREDHIAFNHETGLLHNVLNHDQRKSKPQRRRARLQASRNQ